MIDSDERDAEPWNHTVFRTWPDPPDSSGAIPKPCVAGSIPAGGAQAKNLPTVGPGLTNETESTSDF